MVNGTTMGTCVGDVAWDGGWGVGVEGSAGGACVGGGVVCSAEGASDAGGVVGVGGVVGT